MENIEKSISLSTDINPEAFHKKPFIEAKTKSMSEKDIKKLKPINTHPATQKKLNPSQHKKIIS